MRMQPHRRGTCWIAGSLLLVGAGPLSAASLDQLTDLSGKVVPIVTLKGRDNFNSEYRYDVNVKNLSADTFIGDSLFI